MACDVNQLLDDACTNKFTCLPTLRAYDIVMAQLLCEVKDAIIELKDSIPPAE